jgi:Na+/alanine symporter
MVIIGGIQINGKVTSFFIPISTGFYLIAGLIGIIMNFNLNLIPEILATIIIFSFTGEAAVGGAIGTAIRFGVARCLFTNEAGFGSAPIATSITGVTIVMSVCGRTRVLKLALLQQHSVSSLKTQDRLLLQLD